MSQKIGVLVGSLRKESYSRKIARNMIQVFPKDYELELIEIGNLPFYNEDLEAEEPAEYKAFRKKINAKDAIVFITPEYNRSVPAVLKNALDVGSRPYGKSVWDGKPALVVSISQGSISGFGANHHLRQSLVFLNMYPLQQPEVYLAKVQAQLDDKGEAVESLNKFFGTVVEAFLQHLKRFAA